jgi:uncharacterized protein (DUF302 family)
MKKGINWEGKEHGRGEKIAFTTVLDVSFEEALTRIRDALQSEGFGIITEIDVKATL